MVTCCWERAELSALVCGVLLLACHFPIGILGQVWYLIVSIPDPCSLTYFYSGHGQFAYKTNDSMVANILLTDPTPHPWGGSIGQDSIFQNMGVCISIERKRKDYPP